MLKKREKLERRRNIATDVILLLDASGSMNPRRDETIREVNRYLDSLRSDGGRYYVTVKTFNTNVDTLISHENIKDVGDLEHSEYRPEGWTALLDAVGEALTDPRWHYADWERKRTLFVVVTDGEENRSKRYGLGEIRDMIDRKRSDDFQFVFLGNGPGSWKTGQSLGFNISVSTDWDNPRNSENIYKSLYTASNTVSTGGIIGAQAFNTGSTKGISTNPDDWKVKNG